VLKKIIIFSLLMVGASCKPTDDTGSEVSVDPQVASTQPVSGQTASPTAASGPMMERMAPDGSVQQRVRQNGSTYELIDGAVYELSGNSRNFYTNAYDPDFYAKNYAEEDGQIFRVDPNTGQRFPIWRTFVEDFENISSYRDLVAPEKGWTGLTLLEPSAPTVGASIKLREAYLSGKTDFRDNRLDITRERQKSGQQALRLLAVPPSKDMLVTKSSMDTAILHFVEGEDFWFSGWFYLEQGTPLGILDIECSFIDEGPGMRLLLNKEGEPRLELKWADKPTYRAQSGRRFEVGRWIKVRLHLYLSASDAGRAELWFDDDKVIDSYGQTFPIPKAVYDRIQIGVTANPAGSTSVMFIDSLRISPDPL